MLCQKRCFFGFFGLFSTTALRIFLTFSMSVEDSRTHRLSQIVLLKKFSIPNYKGLSVKNGVWVAFLQNCATVGPFLPACFNVNLTLCIPGLGDRVLSNRPYLSACLRLNISETSLDFGPQFK